MNGESIVALIFGSLGFVTGGIGLIVAYLARVDARKANEIAAAANRISEEANGLSHEANEISRSSAARESERHDAKWEGRWIRPGVYALRNVGTSTTHAGRVTVTVDREEQTETFDVLEAGKDLEFEFPGAARTYAEEQREEREHERRRSEARRPRQSSIMSSFAVEPFEPPRLPATHGIWTRVVWETELGTPKEIELRDPFATIAPD
jgi:hypothetical protein